MKVRDAIRTIEDGEAIPEPKTIAEYIVAA
jgi:hypothetical protein